MKDKDKPLKDDAVMIDELTALGFKDTAGALKNLKLLAHGPLGGHIDDLIKLAAKSPLPERALTNIERIIEGQSAETLQGFLKDTDNIARLITISGSSMMLSNILIRHHGFFEELFCDRMLFQEKEELDLTKELHEYTQGAVDFDSTAAALRVFRQREYLRLGARDLLGLAPMERITSELSSLASVSLDAAINFAQSVFKKRYGTPLLTEEDRSGARKEARFAVIGMGKLGGEELNFCSDIDLIYIYSSDKGETTGVEDKPNSKIDLHTYFVKMSEMVTKLISTITDEGFVFRVDLELRPEGKSGEVVNSLRSAELYYESWGRTWERSAMIKARCVGGSRKLGDKFLKMMEPFIYRRHIDFTALDEIKSMKEKLDLALLRRNPEAVDVKLGQGGIREIEFLCQALQLIHGGRIKDVRERGTLKTIERLRENEFIRDIDACILVDNYVFLRNTEHRLQIFEGGQTQTIPIKSMGRAGVGQDHIERLARTMGFTDTRAQTAGESFWEDYKKRTDAVYEIYRGLFYQSKEELKHGVSSEVLALLSIDTSDEDGEQGIHAMGFKDAKVAWQNLKLLRDGPSYLALSNRAHLLMERLAPFLLSRTAACPDPDRALGYLERFLSAAGAKTVLYSLLSENPNVAELLIKIFGTSEFLSRTLIEHPGGLDLLLSKDILRPAKIKTETLSQIRALVTDAKDYEEQLDVLRRYKNQELFRIGINDILGSLSPAEVSSQITELAECTIEVACEMAITDISQKYGLPTNDPLQFAVLGAGKLGSRELIYGSDLDIIFVYCEEQGTPGLDETNGPKVISTHEFYAKLVQRVISILSLHTREGIAFSVDMRLRPSGSAGPLVVSQSSFLDYQGEKTGVWERLAMVRTRAVAGEPKFGTKLVAELYRIIFSLPPKPEDIKEIMRIRERMEREIAQETKDKFNLKTGRGGIVDIEFLTQTLQLRYGSSVPALTTPSTIEALEALSKEGLITPEEFEALTQAHAFLRLLETGLRIVHDRPEGDIQNDPACLVPLATRIGLTEELKGAEAGEKLLRDYTAHTTEVRKIYSQIFKKLML